MPIDILKLENIIKNHSFDEAMLLSSLERLKTNKALMVINLGTLRIEIEQISEIAPVIKVLKKY